jgi:hypothetical protein
MARVHFNYTSPAYRNLPSPDPSATFSYTWTETLKGSLTGALPPGSSGLGMVDLEIDGVPSSDKETVGGLVVKHITAEEDPDGGDNEAPRLKITLSGCSGIGDKVHLADPGDKVKIYTEPTGGEPLKFDGTDNLFDSGSLPKDFYVEGVKPSEEMRDIDIVASIQQVGVAAVPPPPPVHLVSHARFTDLYADKPTIQWQGQIPEKLYYYLKGKGFDYATSSTKLDWVNGGLMRADPLSLGQHEFETYFKDGQRRSGSMGVGVVGNARVHPPDFRASEFGVMLKLDRDAAGVAFEAGKQVSIAGFSGGVIPPANDSYGCPSTGFLRNDSGQRDDSPTALNDGMIHNVDVPGWKYYQAQMTVTSCLDGANLTIEIVTPKPTGTVVSFKKFFKLFGAVRLPWVRSDALHPDGWVRCSPMDMYSISASWKEVQNTGWDHNGEHIIGGFEWSALTLSVVEASP